MPVTAEFVIDRKSTTFHVVNDDLSALEKLRESVLQPLDVLKFDQTGIAASITVEREVWKGDYHHKASCSAKATGSTN